MFRVSQHPSSGVLKTVTATSGTGHNTGTATSLQRGLIGTFSYRRPICICSLTDDIQTMYKLQVYTSPLVMRTDLHIPSSSDLLAISIKLEAKGNSRVATNFLFHVT